MRANYIVVLSVKNAHPYFEWNRLLVTGIFFFSRKQMKTRQENVGLANSRCAFAKLFMYEHYSYKKDVWTEFINGIEGMNVIYSPRLHLVQ